MPSSCFGLIFLPVPWLSEIPPGPSTPAFSDKRTAKVGGAHLNFPSSEVLPQKSDRDQYELLCLDNTRKPVDQFEECYLARVPSHAVVARAVDGKEDLIWEILKVAQVSRPSPLTFSPTYLQLRVQIFLTSRHTRAVLVYVQETVGTLPCVITSSTSPAGMPCRVAGASSGINTHHEDGH